MYYEDKVFTFEVINQKPQNYENFKDLGGLSLLMFLFVACGEGANASKKFEEIMPLSNGVAWAKWKGKWGVVNQDLTILIQNHFDSIPKTFLLNNHDILLNIQQNTTSEYLSFYETKHVDGKVREKGYCEVTFKETDGTIQWGVMNVFS